MGKIRNSLDDFRLELIIDDIRGLLVTDSIEIEKISNIEWLIRLLLMSKDVFPTVKEVDIFLSNMTGVQHRTKSTGRDRIIDWYFRYIQDLDPDKQNHVLHKISKYLFISFSSNYGGWKKALYKGKK